MSAHVTGHCSWNHEFWFGSSTPQPNSFDESQYTWPAGLVGGKNDTPLQYWSKQCHQAISAQDSTYRQMKWYGLETIESKENRLNMKMRPGRTIVAEWDKWSSNDSCWFRVQDFLNFHLCETSHRHVTLPAGTLSCSMSVSDLIYTHNVTVYAWTDHSPQNIQIQFLHRPLTEHLLIMMMFFFFPNNVLFSSYMTVSVMQLKKHISRNVHFQFHIRTLFTNSPRTNCFTFDDYLQC